MNSPGSTRSIAIPINLTLIFAGLTIAAILSMFSGFHTFPVPFDIAWQFSPIGMLQGLKPDYLELESVSCFTGKFGLTFDYAIVFLKTCALESPLYWLCYRRLPFSAFLALLVVSNLVTHPAVFFVIPNFFDRYITAALFSEAFAPLAEMAIAYWALRRWSPDLQPGSPGASRTRALARTLWILAANLFSWEVGMFILG